MRSISQRTRQMVGTADDPGPVLEVLIPVAVASVLTCVLLGPYVLLGEWRVGAYALTSAVVPLLVEMRHGSMGLFDERRNRSAHRTAWLLLWAGFTAGFAVAQLS